MRKITDGYARQTLKATLGGEVPFKPEWIRAKKTLLHIGRVIRFKRKELERTLDPVQKPLAKQVYQDAHDFMEWKKNNSQENRTV